MKYTRENLIDGNWYMANCVSTIGSRVEDYIIKYMNKKDSDLFYAYNYKRKGVSTPLYSLGAFDNIVRELTYKEIIKYKLPITYYEIY